MRLAFSKWTSFLCRTSCQWCTSSSSAWFLSVAWTDGSILRLLVLPFHDFARWSKFVSPKTLSWLLDPWTVGAIAGLCAHYLCRSWTWGCFIYLDAFLFRSLSCFPQAFRFVQSAVRSQFATVLFQFDLNWSEPPASDYALDLRLCVNLRGFTRQSCHFHEGSQLAKFLASRTQMNPPSYHPWRTSSFNPTAN